MVLLTRKIEFSASHLYHNPNLSAQENRRIFGKCNNPHGHGHNYTLQVTIEGEPDPVTGMVLDLKELKGILEREIMQRMKCRSSPARFPPAKILPASSGNSSSQRLRKGGCIVCGSTNRRISSSIVTATARTGPGSHERCA